MGSPNSAPRLPNQPACFSPFLSPHLVQPTSSPTCTGTVPSPGIISSAPWPGLPQSAPPQQEGICGHLYRGASLCGSRLTQSKTQSPPCGLQALHNLPHHLLALPSLLTLSQPHWLPLCSFSTPGTGLPHSLCIDSELQDAVNSIICSSPRWKRSGSL